MTTPPLRVVGGSPTLVDAWDARKLIADKAAELRRQFPACVPWWGPACRSWFAVVRLTTGRWRLLEADGPYDLAALIKSACVALAEPVEPAKSPASPRPGRHARKRRNKLLH